MRPDPAKQRASGRSAKSAGFLWLLCLCFGLLPAFVSASPDPGLVYCPLQKIWVKKGGEVVKTDPLSTVCASDRTKEEFSYLAFRKLGSTAGFGDRQIEKLFFDHARLGDKAFGQVRSGHAPDRPSLGGSGRSEKFTANELNTSPERVLEPLSTTAASVVVDASKESHYQRSLINTSRGRFRTSIPRGPPASLFIG